MQSALRQAKLPILLSVSSYLFSGNDNFLIEKRGERKVKREKYKKKRQLSIENCRFFLVEVGRANRYLFLEFTMPYKVKRLKPKLI